MRLILCCAVVLIGSAVTAAAADVSGNWRGTLTPENRDPGSALLILKQTGDVVTGTGGEDEGDRHEITNGKVTGNTFTFDVHVGDRTMRFVLTLDGNELTGQVTRERDGQQQKATVALKRE